MSEPSIKKFIAHIFQKAKQLKTFLYHNKSEIQELEKEQKKLQFFVNTQCNQITLYHLQNLQFLKSKLNRSQNQLRTTKRQIQKEVNQVFSLQQSISQELNRLQSQIPPKKKEIGEERLPSCQQMDINLQERLLKIRNQQQKDKIISALQKQLQQATQKAELVKKDSLKKKPTSRSLLQIHWIVFTLQAVHMGLILGSISTVTFSGSFLRDFMIDFKWLLYSTCVIYMVTLMLVHFFKQNLNDSFVCYFFWILVVGCESILLGYGSLIFQEYYILYQLSILTGVFTGLSLFSLVIKGSYTGRIGKPLAMLEIVIGFVIIVVFEDDKLTYIIVVTLIQAVVTAFLAIYLWFLVGVVDEILSKLKSENRFKPAVYVQILLTHKKIAWVLAAFTINYICCRSKDKETEEDD